MNRKKLLVATYDTVGKEAFELHAQLEGLAAQLFKLQTEVERIEAEAMPLVDAFLSVRDELEPRLTVVNGLATLIGGAGFSPEYYIPGIVGRLREQTFSESPFTDDCPFFDLGGEVSK